MIRTILYSLLVLPVLCLVLAIAWFLWPKDNDDHNEEI